MATTPESIHKDMQKIKNELSFLRHIVEEYYDISDEAADKLEKARSEMKNGDYVPHEDVIAKYG